jgi:pSer/pThr/pTyr-binding forkhead associated (FHA) protein
VPSGRANRDSVAERDRLTRQSNGGIDIESTNGTLLHGILVRPDEPVRLADRDVIQLGAVVARYTAPSPDDGALRAP